MNSAPPVAQVAASQVAPAIGGAHQGDATSDAALMPGAGKDDAPDHHCGFEMTNAIIGDRYHLTHGIGRGKFGRCV